MTLATAPDEAGIERLVRRFYGSVQDDALLAPIFADRVGDWERHIATLCDFWSGILLGTERYGGRPLAAHVSLPVEPVHFQRWLQLFEAAAREVFAAPLAELLIERAGRIAQSFSHGIAATRGTLPERRGIAPVTAGGSAGGGSTSAACGSVPARR